VVGTNYGREKGKSSARKRASVGEGCERNEQGKGEGGRDNLLSQGEWVEEGQTGEVGE
jgi:hypothetical protein